MIHDDWIVWNSLCPLNEINFFTQTTIINDELIDVVRITLHLFPTLYPVPVMITIVTFGSTQKMNQSLGECLWPSFPLSACQLVLRYLQDNAFPVHRGQWHGKMRPFSKLPCRMLGLSSSSQQHFSNSDWISGAVLTQAITENGLWLSISVYTATTSLISLKGCAALKMNGKAVPKYGNYKTATAFRGGEQFHFLCSGYFQQLYI